MSKELPDTCPKYQETPLGPVHYLTLAWFASLPSARQWKRMGNERGKWHRGLPTLEYHHNYASIQAAVAAWEPNIETFLSRSLPPAPNLIINSDRETDK